MNNYCNYHKLGVKKKQLMKSSPYFIEDIACRKRGDYLWTVSNSKYVRKDTKSLASSKKIVQKKRAPASIETEKDERLVVKKKKSESNKKTHFIYLGLSSSAASIASNDTASNSTEKAFSDLGYGVTAVWSHLWTKNLNFFAVASLKKYKFKMGESRSLEDANVTHSYVGTGLNIKIGNRFTLTPGLGIGESLILASSGGSVFEIKKASIPAASLSAKIDIAKFDSGFNLYTNMRVGALVPTSQDGYKTKFGHYQQLGFGSSFGAWGSQENMKMNINANYTGRELEVGNAKQTSKDLGISVGLDGVFKKAFHLFNPFNPLFRL